MKSHGALRCPVHDASTHLTESYLQLQRKSAYAAAKKVAEARERALPDQDPQMFSFNCEAESDAIVKRSTPAYRTWQPFLEPDDAVMNMLGKLSLMERELVWAEHESEDTGPSEYNQHMHSSTRGCTR